jgi:hypothetical protein
MRTTIYTLLFATISLFTVAQNNLVVFTDDGEKFIMYVNSVQLNEMPEANVKAENLSGEGFRIKLAFNNKSIPELTKSIYFEKPGLEYTFVVKKNKKDNYVMRFMSEAPVSQQPEQNIPVEETVYENPQYSGNSTTETVTGTVVHETNTTTSGQALDAGSTSISMSVTEEGINMSVNDSEMPESVSFDLNVGEGGAPTQTSVTTTTTTTYNESVTVQSSEIEEYQSVSGENTTTSLGRCSYPVDNSEFADIKISLNKKTFEDSKLTLAKQIAKSKCFTSAQIRDIMGMYDFEDTRLEFAKYAYEYVYDPDNYYLVNDAFQFEMTIEELDEFIRN